ncbi:MAG: GNAT family N-acetyltransferase, partial [Cyanobacteria bacterium P01_A01_bin.135]
MAFDFQPLQRHQALAIVSWHYPAPYDIYNVEPEHRQADVDYLLHPQNSFFAILGADGGLEGYCSFGRDGQVLGGDYSSPALDICMGIRPDLTGQGNGHRYAQAVIRYGFQHYGAKQLRVTIAAFNQRAQR